jgi:hypothetical protein
MWRDEQTNKKQNKHTNKQTKIPCLGTIVFSSRIQSWCWYLSRSSVVVLPGGWVGFFFFFRLSEELGQLLPQWGVAV